MWYNSFFVFCFFARRPVQNDIELSSVPSEGSTEDTTEQESESLTVSIKDDSNGSNVADNEDVNSLIPTATDHSPTNNADKIEQQTSEKAAKDSKQSRRKSSFVLNLIEGRRDSVTLQYAKLPRSLVKWRKREELKSITESDMREEEEGEENEEDKVMMEDESSGDTDRLLLSRRNRCCSKAWWLKKLRNVKLSVWKSLKNMKFFFKY